MGRSADAELHYREALRANEGMSARPRLARSQLRCAELLLRSGRGADRRRAGELLEAALSTARHTGLEALAARAETRFRQAAPPARSG